MSDETPTTDSLGQLAVVLRSERLRRGLSIEDIARLVNISASHIERLENGEFSYLPPLYVFAYLRKYAVEVGVADESLLSSCRRELQLPETANFDASSKQEPARKQRRSIWGRNLLIVSGILLLLLSILYFTRDFWSH